MYVRAWNAVARRYVTMAACDERFAQSVRVSDMPEPPERQRQEEDLFGFFVNGLACLDSLLYATHAIGWIGNSAFDLSTERRRKSVLWRVTPTLLRQEFPRQRIGRRLEQLNRSRDLQNWRKHRNTLAHREAPPRHATVMLPGGTRGATWGRLALTDRTTADHRAWLAGTLATFTDEVRDFAVGTL